MTTPGRSSVVSRIAIAGAPVIGVAFAVIIAIASGASVPAIIFATVAAAIAMLALICWHQFKIETARATLIRETERINALDPAQTPREQWNLQPTDPSLAPLADQFATMGHRLRSVARDAARKTSDLEALIDAIDEPVLATDRQQSVLLCNRAAETTLGAEPGTLIGRSLRELLTSSELLTAHTRALAGENRRMRMELTTPIGRRTFHVTAAPVPVAWGQGVFGALLFMRDVTELHDSVRARTDFVANASHELRTPVAALRGAAETLHDAIDDPHMARRCAEMIDSHAIRLEELIRDLLDLSHLESPDIDRTIESIALQDIAANLDQLFAQDCSSVRVSLQFELHEVPQHVHTDKRLLMLMLRNLIENAVKFTRPDTTVRVVATVETQLAVPTLTIKVIDQGIGIPLAHQKRVFERFFQVDASRTTRAGARRGTGLGLAIVKHAARALGGQVGLESEYQRGATVWFTIPILQTDQSSGAASTPAS